MLLNTYPLMSALAWALFIGAFYVPARELWRIWRDRPLVIWDPEMKAWRSARRVRAERY